MNHTAWRFLQTHVAYVESIAPRGAKGDRYSYTSDADKALQMSDAQCRAFCRYMHECGTVGFWN